MAKRKNEEKKRRDEDDGDIFHRLHPDTKKSIWGVVFLGLSIIFILADVRKAGPFGAWLYSIFETLLGIGYFILPAALFFAAAVLFVSHRKKLVLTTLVGALFLVLSVLGGIHVLSPGRAGWLGYGFGSLAVPLGNIAALVVNILLAVIAVLITANIPIRLHLPKRKPKEDIDEEVEIIEPESSEEPLEETPQEPKEGQATEEEKRGGLFGEIPKRKKVSAPHGDYVPPPLSLLPAGVDKPTTGDLRANANIIKRTLESFGIAVEMGEINVGPKVTRYTLKPAEGMKLARITALSQDLALALAAHPIRIEAPIPGKSLVGIEVPNKAAALVRLGNLMGYEDFAAAGALGFALGRDVTGEPIFANIDKMPHLLVAGATGSGKSVIIHSLLTSLLYKNGPATLRLVLIDPKRVELIAYEGIPHLVSPVITENKKAIGVFRWALSEMDRRYDLLVGAGNRDIKGYNASHKDEPIPYLVIVVDELADLMATYGREVEGSIVRLAQMARATGIHLVLSTQRPSVEVITGLIKANITSRIALQVASQVDSRTILDTSGAEKLLGGGDLLLVSAELSKPKRIQGAYIAEDEIRKVTSFIVEHNKTSLTTAEVSFGENGNAETGMVTPDLDSMADGDDDELYDEAVKVVAQAQKASASLLQRRLKVGYARAARLLDIMEERGVVGPGDGAKPREVYVRPDELGAIENQEQLTDDI